MAQAVSRSPSTAALGSRVRVSVTPCGFRGGQIGVWVDFLGGFSRFPAKNFHSIISPPSSHEIKSITLLHLKNPLALC